MLVLGGGDAGAEGRGPWERLARGFTWVCNPFPSAGEVETTNCFSSGLSHRPQMARTSSPKACLTWEPVSMQVHLMVPNCFTSPGSSKESQCRHRPGKLAHRALPGGCGVSEVWPAARPLGSAARAPDLTPRARFRPQHTQVSQRTVFGRSRL